MAINFMLPLRVAQFVAAIIVLGLNGYVANRFDDSIFSGSPNEVNFLIFSAVWTAVLAVPYLLLTPRFFPKAAHPYAIAAVEAVTMIFWFAGFIAQAVYITRLLFCSDTICECMEAATVFGAFEWAMFAVTTVMGAMHAMRASKGGAGKINPTMTNQP